MSLMLTQKVTELEGKLRGGECLESTSRALSEIMSDFDAVAASAKLDIERARFANPAAVQVGDELLDHVQKAFFAVGSLRGTLTRPDTARLDRGCYRLREATSGIQSATMELRQVGHAPQTGVGRRGTGV